MSDIASWLEALGPDATRLNVVFVSVDPERDTPAALADYVAVLSYIESTWPESIRNQRATARE